MTARKIGANLFATAGVFMVAGIAVALAGLISGISTVTYIGLWLEVVMGVCLLAGALVGIWG